MSNNIHLDAFAVRGFINSLDAGQRKVFSALFSDENSANTLKEAYKILNADGDTNRNEALGYTILSAVSYSLPRMSAAPSITCDEVKRNWELISQEVQALILLKVQDALDNNRIQMECDQEEWKSLINFLKLEQQDSDDALF